MSVQKIIEPSRDSVILLPRCYEVGREILRNYDIPEMQEELKELRPSNYAFVGEEVQENSIDHRRTLLQKMAHAKSLHSRLEAARIIDPHGKEAARIGIGIFYQSTFGGETALIRTGGTWMIAPPDDVFDDEPFEWASYFAAFAVHARAMTNHHFGWSFHNAPPIPALVRR